jgi:hypothetical protein
MKNSPTEPTPPEWGRTYKNGDVLDRLILLLAIAASMLGGVLIGATLISPPPSAMEHCVEVLQENHVDMFLYNDGPGPVCLTAECEDTDAMSVCSDITKCGASHFIVTSGQK